MASIVKVRLNMLFMKKLAALTWIVIPVLQLNRNRELKNGTGTVKLQFSWMLEAMNTKEETQPVFVIFLKVHTVVMAKQIKKRLSETKAL